MALVVVHWPMLGYANNFDFIKLSGTTGVWVDVPGVDLYKNHPEAPLPLYKSHGRKMSEVRYLSSEVLIVRLAILLSDVVNLVRGLPRSHFPMRVLGFTKLLLVFGAGAWLTWLFFRRSPWQGLASALLFCVFVADPVNSLYFNTLYFETSTVLFGYLAVGMGVLVASGPRAPTWQVGVLCAALALAGFGKMQHIALPLAIGLALCVVLSRGGWGREGRARRVVLPVMATALVVVALGLYNNARPSMRGMVNATKTDRWMLTLLPAADDKPGAIARLGLPPECVAYLGRSSVDPVMERLPCPGILQLGSLQVVRFLVSEPRALGRILLGAVEKFRPFIVFYGQVEGEHYGKLQELGSRFAGLNTLFMAMPFGLFAALVALSLLSGGVAIAGFLWGRAVPGGGLLVLLNAVFTSTFLVCLFGDGYSDFARHNHVGQNALMAAMVVAVYGLLRLAFSALKRVRAEFVPSAVAQSGPHGR
jgi:hypothetical protein